jgi:hypothetical protein
MFLTSLTGVLCFCTHSGNAIDYVLRNLISIFNAVFNSQIKQNPTYYVKQRELRINIFPAYSHDVLDYIEVEYVTIFTNLVRLIQQ